MKKFFAKVFLSVVAISGCAALFIGGFNLGKYTVDKQYKKDLIDRGFAQFNQKTGEWEYRDVKDLGVINSINFETNGSTLGLMENCPLPEKPVKQSNSNSNNKKIVKR